MSSKWMLHATNAGSFAQDFYAKKINQRLLHILEPIFVFHLNFERWAEDNSTVSWSGKHKIHNYFNCNCCHVTNISLLLLVLLDALQLVTGVTGLFSQGVTAVVHGCSICALDPSGESLLCRRGVGWSPPVSITQSLALSTLRSTPMKGHKQAAFNVRFIEKLVLEVGVVSQQYSGMQYKSQNTGM